MTTAESAIYEEIGRRLQAKLDGPEYAKTHQELIANTARRMALREAIEVVAQVKTENDR